MALEGLQDLQLRDLQPASGLPIQVAVTSRSALGELRGITISTEGNRSKSLLSSSQVCGAVSALPELTPCLPFYVEWSDAIRQPTLHECAPPDVQVRLVDNAGNELGSFLIRVAHKAVRH